MFKQRFKLKGISCNMFQRPSILYVKRAVNLDIAVAEVTYFRIKASLRSVSVN